MCQEKRKTNPIIYERPHIFLLSLGAHLSNSIIPHASRTCQRPIYTQQTKQSISEFAHTASAERACPTLGIWEKKACGRGSMCWFHRGPRTKGAPEFGS